MFHLVDPGRRDAAPPRGRGYRGFVAAIGGGDEGQFGAVANFGRRVSGPSNEQPSGRRRLSTRDLARRMPGSGCRAVEQKPDK